MKTFAALLLISAFLAYVAAKEMAFHKTVFQFLDERHDDRMAQVLRDHGDQGMPADTLVANDHPEPEYWMKPCVENAKRCWNNTGHDACKKLACIDDMIHCAIQNRPSPYPTATPLEKGCVVLLYLCRHHSSSCVGELCCFVRIKRSFDMKKGEPAEE